MRKTFGGRQFWTDHFLHHDWRIQRHYRSDRFRLLDDEDRWRHEGSFDECLSEFQRIARHESVPPMNSTVVVLLHGLGDERRLMRHLTNRLRDLEGYSAVSMNYASTRHPVADHARAVASVVHHLPPASTIHFIGYSMGAIVVRHFFRDCAQSGRSLQQLGRMVMIASPNKGASLAAKFGRGPVLGAILGESFKQLGRRWERLEQRLAVPPCEFGIIAGKSGGYWGRNPLISGANDWIVGVEETKLPGAVDFRELPVPHALMPRSRRVIDCAVRFLEQGYFESAATARPLTGNTLCEST